MNPNRSRQDPNDRPHEIVQRVVDVFDHRGSEQYADEAVTQRQHALQCAALAEREGAAPELVAAALLHDIGHIMDAGVLPTDRSENLDDRHEMRANDWLTRSFGTSVSDPVRLHVLAKRYLCTVSPEYQQTLSPTSFKSFHDQGGQLSAGELESFEREPCYREAVRLRRWDDLAKDAKAMVPDIEHYLPVLESLAAV